MSHLITHILIHTIVHSIFAYRVEWGIQSKLAESYIDVLSLAPQGSRGVHQSDSSADPLLQFTRNALSKHSVKWYHRIVCLEISPITWDQNWTSTLRLSLTKKSLTHLLHLEWWYQVWQWAGILSPGSGEVRGCCPPSRQNTCDHTALFHPSGSSKDSLGGHTPHTASR